MKNKIILNLINYPGSGSHFLMDIMAILNVTHNPILDLIAKIIKYKKGNELNFDDLNVKRKLLFKKIYKKIKDENAFNDFGLFSKIVEEEILDKIKKNTFIMMPQIFFEGNHLNFNEEDLNFINNVLLNLNNQKQSFINLVYLRHPNDILISKMKRFIRKNDTNKFEKEIQKIISFYKYNHKLIETFYIKYEDLILNKDKTIIKILKLIGSDENQNLAATKEFHVYRSSAFYKELYNFHNDINFLSKIYPTNNQIKKKIKIQFIQKNIDQLKIIYSYLVKANHFNDGAYHRSSKTIFSKIFIKFLLLIPRFKKNYKKLTDIHYREKNKNLIIGI